jgi:predicted Rossmann-fold nucleotide-binding protein
LPESGLSSLFGMRVAAFFGKSGFISRKREQGGYAQLMTRVLVCGGRDFDDRAALYAALDRLYAQHRFTVLIAGGARGADMLAVQWARDRGIRTRIFLARWRHQGAAAGPIRNMRMLKEGRPDLVIAFPGGKGTAGMMALAQGAGVPVVRPHLRRRSLGRTRA